MKINHKKNCIFGRVFYISVNGDTTKLVKWVEQVLDDMPKQRKLYTDLYTLEPVFNKITITIKMQKK